MFDRSDETPRVRPRRVEVFTEPERRRDWPDERKIAIVAESLVPGVNISAVARSHGLNPQQLFGWRKRFRQEAASLMTSLESTPAFACAIVEPEGSIPAPAALPGPPACSGEGSIEVSVGGAKILIRGAVDAKTLAMVLKALKVIA